VSIRSYARSSGLVAERRHHQDKTVCYDILAGNNNGVATYSYSRFNSLCLVSCLYALQRNGLPPITTHNVVDDWNDPVLNAIRRCNLFNTVNDRVKVTIACASAQLTRANNERTVILYSWYFIPSFCLRRIRCSGSITRNLSEDVTWVCSPRTMNLGDIHRPSARSWAFPVLLRIYRALGASCRNT